MRTFLFRLFRTLSLVGLSSLSPISQTYLKAQAQLLLQLQILSLAAKALGDA
jgi:hypothetical protein